MAAEQAAAVTPYALHVIDVVAFGIIATSAIVASFRGFTREFFGVGAWIAGLFAGAYGTRATFDFWKEFLQNELLANITGFVVFFILTLTFCMVISQKVVQRLGDSPLNILDRSTGFLFGFARGMVILGLCYLVISSFAKTDEDLPSWAKQSRFLPQIQQTAKLLVTMMPYDEKPKKGKDGQPIDSNANPDEETLSQESSDNGDQPGETEKEPTYNGAQRNEMDQLVDTVDEQ
jgi:membrane protein required for colicin V production